MEQITKEELLDVTGKFELGNHPLTPGAPPAEAVVDTVILDGSKLCSVTVIVAVLAAL